MKEVLPGIYQMPLTLSGFDPNTVNTYLIRDHDSFALIDTGWDSPPAVESLEKQMAEIGAGFADIGKVIITHCHIDHFGLIPRLKKNFHVRTYFHQNELNLIRARFTEADNFLPMTDNFLRIHGVPDAELGPPEFTIPMAPDLATISPDIPLQGNEEIIVGDYTLTVINTPGHTPGHVTYFEKNKKFLFSGDVLLPTIATNAAMHIPNIPYPIQQYLNSLRTLKELDIDLVLPGHEYVFSGHRQRIEELIKHHQEKSAEIRGAFIPGRASTAYDVSQTLFRSPTKNVWPNFTGWDKRFALLQIIAYLESETYNQVLVRDTKNGIFYYHLKY